MANKDDFGEMDEFDFDNDEFSMDIGEEEPSPANSREAVSRSVKDGYKGFKESFTNDKTETISKLVEAAVPSSLSSEVSAVKDIKDNMSEEFKKATTEVRTTARSTLKTIETVLPKNDKVKKIFDKLSDIVGADDKANNNGPSKEEILNNNIREEITGALGEQSEREQVEDLIKEQVAANRFKSALELSGLISADVTQLRKFNTSVTSRYFRKSLELQFKSLYVSKEQLEVTKSGFDLFKGQFETIVNNTALPDIVKTRKSEAFKAQLTAKTISDIQSGMFKEGSVLGGIKKNITGMITNAKDMALGGLGMVDTTAGMSGGMGGMPGVSKSNMVGDEIGNWVRNKLGGAIGDRISKTERGNSFINGIKNAAVDPSEYLNTKADELNEFGADSDNKLKKFGSKAGSKILDMLSGVTKVDNNDLNTISIEKEDLSAPTIFDGRTRNSIVQIIPGLLSKIYSEIKTARVGGSASDNEIKFDNDSQKFVSSKKAGNILNKDITRKVNTTTSSNLDMFIDLLVREGGLKEPSAGDRGKLRKGITKYIVSGKSLIPYRLMVNGFTDGFDKNLKRNVTSALNIILDKSKTDHGLMNSLNNGLKRIKESLPNINNEINNIISDGNINDLVKSGIVKYDKTTKQHTVNSDKIKEMIVNATGVSAASDLPKETITSTKSSVMDDAKETLKSKFGNKISNVKSGLHGQYDMFAKSKTSKDTHTIANNLTYGVSDISINSMSSKLKPVNNITKESISKKVKDGNAELNNSITKLTDTLKNENKLSTTDKAKKQDVFDRDGDGDRDGNWKERLASLSKKNTSDKKLVKEKNKKESSGIFGLLTSMLGMVGKIGKGILGLPLALGGMLAKTLPSLLGKGLVDAVKLAGKGMWGAAKLIANSAPGVVGKIATSLDKVVGGIGKTGLAAGKALTGLGSKSAGKKIKTGVVKGFLGKVKSTILKKFGKVAGAKLLGKIATRFVPFVGTAMLAYDAANIAMDMFNNKTSFKSAVSKQIIGFDIFDDESVAKDDDGNLIKPDEPAVKDTVVKNNHVNNIELSNSGRSKDTFIKNSTMNNTNVTNADNEPTIKDSVPSVKNKFSGATLRSALVRNGEMFSPDNGEENLVMADKSVTTSGLNPAMHDNLKAMANEYYSLTGKKITLNSAYRSTEYQRKLRARLGNKAAKPGHSTHEFGLAVDINSSTMDELEKLGLMGKYKFTRPVGREKWHMEPAGIQLDIDGAKKDPNYAAKLIDSVSNGGGGWGLVSGTRKYSRNKDFQESLIKSTPKIINDTDSKNDTTVATMNSGVKSKADTKLNTLNNTNYKGSSGVDTISKKKEIIPKVNSADMLSTTDVESNKLNAVAKSTSNLIKPANESIEIGKLTNETLNSIDYTLKQSLEIQLSTLDVMKGLSKLSNANTLTSESKDVKKQVNNSVMEPLPDPAVSLARKKY